MRSKESAWAVKRRGCVQMNTPGEQTAEKAYAQCAKAVRRRAVITQRGRALLCEQRWYRGFSPSDVFRHRGVILYLRDGEGMSGWKYTLIIFVTLVAAGIVMISATDMPWYIVLPVFGIVGIALLISIYFEHCDNKKSFEEAKKFSAGYAFKSPREEQRYAAWTAKHQPVPAGRDMLADMISRFRTPRIASYLLGVLALGLIEIILFKEKSEGRGEPGVIYIVLGVMLLLLYLAVADIAGVKARRFYNRLTDRQDFASVERSYTEGVIVGVPRNYINIGPDYIIAVTPKGAAPLRRSDVVKISRADVLTAYYTNSIYSGSKDSYFIKIYTSVAPNLYSVQMNKFNMLMAYEVLKASGLPADDTIEMR